MSEEDVKKCYPAKVACVNFYVIRLKIRIKSVGRRMLGNSAEKRKLNFDDLFIKALALLEYKHYIVFTFLYVLQYSNRVSEVVVAV